MRFTAAVAALALFAAIHGVAAQPGRVPSPVTQPHLDRINALFRSQGIALGRASLDRLGRVELLGQFQDDPEVDRAFSIAQTVVGVRWVSPVTPEHVKVKAWEDCLSRLLAGEACGGAVPAPRTPAQGAPGAGLPAPGTPPGNPPVPASPRALAEAAPGPIGAKYGLVVGVGRFRSSITPLMYANKDAYDVYGYLIDPAGGNFRQENVILLRDEYATRDGVVRALGEIQRVAREDDLVVVYFSSHGTPPDKYGGVHVVTHDSQVVPRERIWDTSVNETILRDFVQNVRAKRLVVMMDACYSNGAYQHIAGFLPPGGKSLDAGTDEGYGRSSRYMAQRLLGAKDLVLDEAPRVAAPGAAKGIGTGWGKVLVSASGAGERSWESDQLRNSVFTRYMIDGLRRQGGSVKDAFDYASPLVRQQVKREKGSELEQNPQLTPNRRDWNMSVAAPGQSG